MSVLAGEQEAWQQRVGAPPPRTTGQPGSRGPIRQRGRKRGGSDEDLSSLRQPERYDFDLYWFQYLFVVTMMIISSINVCTMWWCHITIYKRNIIYYKYYLNVTCDLWPFRFAGHPRGERVWSRPQLTWHVLPMTSGTRWCHRDVTVMSPGHQSLSDSYCESCLTDAFKTKWDFWIAAVILLTWSLFWMLLLG